MNSVVLLKRCRFFADSEFATVSGSIMDSWLTSRLGLKYVVIPFNRLALNLEIMNRPTMVLLNQCRFVGDSEFPKCKWFEFTC